MGIEKIINYITSSSAAQKATAAYNNVCNSIGTAFEKSPNQDVFNKVLKKIEPTGANNSFGVLTTLMFGAVILPRVLTALKRNPDDKEATKDEIIEILFRDIQTVAVILLALKASNSLISSQVTKLTGLPMTNKAYQPLFNSTNKGLKGLSEKAQEIAQNPLEKLKILKKNFLDTINPTGGVATLTNDEFVSKYSNYNSIADVQKMLNEIEPSGGNKEKVYQKIMNALVEDQEKMLDKVQKECLYSANIDGSSANIKEIDNIKANLKTLKEFREKGSDSLNEIGDNKAIENIIISFFKKPANALVMNAKTLNAALRTAALAIEVSYLGFGLPALNQLRLEKKYLKNNKSVQNTTAIDEKTTQAHNVKLYQSFVK